MKHRTMQHAPCGCVVFYVWDDAEPAESRLYVASDPTADDDGLPWTVGAAQRQRVSCRQHAGADHHEHFRKLKMDESQQGVAEGHVEIELHPSGGLRFHRLKG